MTEFLFNEYGENILCKMPVMPTSQELDKFITLKQLLAERKKPMTNPFEGKIKKVIVKG
jgi:hypothetical protein